MFTDVEESILTELLAAGNLSPSVLSDRTPHHPKSISKRLAKLEEDGLVENLGGVWALTVPGVRAAQALNRQSETI